MIIKLFGLNAMEIMEPKENEIVGQQEDSYLIYTGKKDKFTGELLVIKIDTESAGYIWPDQSMGSYLARGYWLPYKGNAKKTKEILDLFNKLKAK